jgi:ElaB/YqjD/DUF883 family membrane-anchored ribosome-binding protein
MARASGNPLQGDLDAIKADIASLTDAIDRLASEGARVQAAMARTVKRSAKNASAAGSDIFDSAWDLSEDSAAAVSNAARTGVSMIEKQVKQNPLGVALVVLGVGFCIGFLRLR